MGEFGIIGEIFEIDRIPLLAGKQQRRHFVVRRVKAVNVADVIGVEIPLRWDGVGQRVILFLVGEVSPDQLQRHLASRQPGDGIAAQLCLDTAHTAAQVVARAGAQQGHQHLLRCGQHDVIVIVRHGLAQRVQRKAVADAPDTGV